MSKIALTSIGAVGVAAAVPLAHLLEKRYSENPRSKLAITVTTMLLFAIGWSLFATGLSTPPKGTEDSVEGSTWKTRQISLSVVGVALVLLGVGAVRYKESLKFPISVGATAFVIGWAILTTAFVYSDPDYEKMGRDEQVGRVIQAVTSTLTIITGAALISMSDSSGAVPHTAKTMEAAAVTTFALGWVNALAVSSLQ